ncbi:MAG: hypothetical protein ABI611_17010 [Solirubrobacteraceae bacterium]
MFERQTARHLRLAVGGRALRDWDIGATLEHIAAPPKCADSELRPVRPAAPGLSVAGILALQRSVGNRGVAQLLGRAGVQRLVPSAGPIAPALEPGGDTASHAEEAAGIAAAARRRADARRLLPEELQEVAELALLTRPQGPGLVLGRGTRKLLDAVDRLGSNRAGAPSDYRRDPVSDGGLPSFVLGDPADPDGRITVTAAGLLEVTKTKRVPQKAKKGQTPPPPKVTRDTVLRDLQGAKVKLAEGAVAADVFLAQAQAEVESEAQETALGALRGSDTPVQGGAADATVGELVSEAASGVYTQRSTTGRGKDVRQSELAKKVMTAFDELRAEFEAFKPPIAVGLATPYPNHETLARAFAAKLQPTLFMTAAAAQAELDQATAALATADAAAAAAKAELAALKATKGVPSAERTAHAAAITAAQERKTAADKVVTAAKRAVRDRGGAKDALVAERDKFATTIAWILDPSKTTTERAAGTVGSLCNVLSFFLYGKAVGVVPAGTDFKDYYLTEVKAGRIRYYKGNSASGVFWGEGSTKWGADRNLIRLEDPDLAAWKPGDPKVVADAIGHPSRQAELRAFLASGANVAITHQDLDNTPPVAAHHFMLIVKDDDGVWRNVDHTSSSFRRRGAITDFNRVFRIDVDAGLIAKARAAQ